MEASKSTKPSVLLIECHPEPDNAKLQPYIDWLTPYFEVKTVYVSNLKSTDVKEDSIVVTGSEWQILKNPVPEIMTKLYLENQKPLLGICWGHQTLAHAWGAKIVSKPLIERAETIRVDKPARLLENMGLFFSVQEAHYEHVVPDGKLKSHFDILAHSDSCKVEAIKHKERTLWGVQFHPERSGNTGLQIALGFARYVTNPR